MPVWLRRSARLVLEFCYSQFQTSPVESGQILAHYLGTLELRRLGLRKPSPGKNCHDSLTPIDQDSSRGKSRFTNAASLANHRADSRETRGPNPSGPNVRGSTRSARRENRWS